MRKHEHFALVFVITVFILLGLAFCEALFAQEYLTFSPEIRPISVEFRQLSYKELRSREICDMAKAEGFSDADCTLMIAHLYKECGSMSETCNWKAGSQSNDYGYAIGIAQWHVCWQYPDWAIKNGYCWRTNTGGMGHGISNAEKMREHFFRDFPEMTDWRGQARKYIAQMKTCDTVKVCVLRWNARRYEYLSEVVALKPVAQNLLN